MSVDAFWYEDANDVIIYEFIGEWTWHEYDAARAECRRLLNTVEHGVDQIYDFSQAPVPPKGLMTKFWQAAISSHRNTSGLIVVIGANKLIEMLTNTVGGLVQRATGKFDVTYISDKSLLDEHLAQRRAVHRA